MFDEYIQQNSAHTCYAAVRNHNLRSYTWYAAVRDHTLIRYTLACGDFWEVFIRYYNTLSVHA